MSFLHQETVLTVNADSTEFCPVEGLQHLLAVGTYELEERSQQRHGLLHLYVLSTAETAAVDTHVGHRIKHQLRETHNLPISGIFDMKWQPHRPLRLLAACADGSLHLLSLQHSGSDYQLASEHKVAVSEGAMATSLDVASSGGQVVTSSSAGTVSLLQVPVFDIITVVHYIMMMQSSRAQVH